MQHLNMQKLQNIEEIRTGRLFFGGAETLKNGVRLMTEKTPIGKGHFHLQPKIDLSDIIEFPAGVWGRAPPEI